MYKDLEAIDSNKKRLAVERLSSRIQVGLPQRQALLEGVMKAVIRDMLVPPKDMEFKRDPQSGVVVTYPIKSLLPHTIHPHALRQMSSVCGIGTPYVNKLLEGPDWKHELLCTNLNELFHKGEYTDRKKNPAKFLHRIVANQLRGFLSRSHNRKLSTAKLIRPFVETCEEYGAGPVEAGTSEVKATLKYMLPTVFEPVSGEFIAFGVSFANSDFGSGRLRVSGTCMRISSGTTAVMEDALSRVHLGKLIEESDLELSQETEDKELQAYQSAVKDVVREQLKPENVQRVLKAIEAAHEKEIPWYKLKGVLSKVLQKKEIDTVEQLLTSSGGDIIDLPPVPTDSDGDPKATAWWSSTVVSWMAQKETDEDKKTDMQTLAGSLLST